MQKGVPKIKYKAFALKPRLLNPSKLAEPPEIILYCPPDFRCLQFFSLEPLKTPELKAIASFDDNLDSTRKMQCNIACMIELNRKVREYGFGLSSSVEHGNELKLIITQVLLVDHDIR